MTLEKTLESPLDWKEIKPVNPKGNQSWIFIGRTNAETEAPILWPPDAKRKLIRKDSDAGKDWRREEKGMTENEMVGWHHWLNGHECEQAWGDGDGQGSLVCCSPWGHKESDMTEQLNWISETHNHWYKQYISINTHLYCENIPLNKLSLYAEDFYKNPWRFPVSVLHVENLKWSSSFSPALLTPTPSMPPI